MALGAILFVVEGSAFWNIDGNMFMTSAQMGLYFLILQIASRNERQGKLPVCMSSKLWSNLSRGKEL